MQPLCIERVTNIYFSIIKNANNIKYDCKIANEQDFFNQPGKSANEWNLHSKSNTIVCYISQTPFVIQSLSKYKLR